MNGTKRVLLVVVGVVAMTMLHAVFPITPQPDAHKLIQTSFKSVFCGEFD
jgi:hypothetical protein